MDKMPYYIFLGVFSLIGLGGVLYPKALYNEMPKVFRKLSGVIWGIDSENPPKGYFTLMRISYGVLFILCMLCLLGILTGFIRVG